MLQTIFFIAGVLFIILSIIFFILSSTTKASIISGQPNATTLQKTANNYNIVAITMLLLSLIICLPAWMYIENTRNI